jgi:O-antigen/teichoic acid export membrane protein
LEPVEPPQKPWRQLTFVLGEAVLSLVSGGVMFIVISRVSGPELLGTYALALAWLMLFQGVSIFGIPGFLMREVGAYGRNAAGQTVDAMLLGLGSGLVALCLMLAAVRLTGYSAELVKVISFASLALIPAFLFTACRSVFLALRKMHFSFLAALVEAAIVMSASLYLLLSGHGAFALVITLVAGKVASAALALMLLHWRVFSLKPSLNLALLIRTAATIFTFGMGSMLSMLTMRINTVMVSLWLDIATVGQFAAATKIMEIGLIVPNLFVQLLTTRIAYNFNAQSNRNPNRFGPWFQILFAIVLPACVGGWVFADLILEILFGPGFGAAAWIVRILMIYLALETFDSMMSSILQAAHRQREDVVRLAYNPVANFLLCLVLLPTLGTIGAAIARVGGVGVSAMLRHLYIAREFTRIRWLRFALKPAAISIGVGAICFLLLDVVHPAWVLLLYVAATAIGLIGSASLSPATIKEVMSSPPMKG